MYGLEETGEELETIVTVMVTLLLLIHCLYQLVSAQEVYTATTLLYVWAGGNGGGAGDNSNRDGYTASQCTLFISAGKCKGSVHYNYTASP